jgi:hypothetical protein
VAEVNDWQTYSTDQQERVQRAIEEAQRNAAVFTCAPDDLFAAEHALLDSLIRECQLSRSSEWHQTAAGQSIVRAAPRERVAVMHAALERTVWAAQQAAREGLLLGSPNFLNGWIARWLLGEGELSLGTADLLRITETLLALGSFLNLHVPFDEAVARIAEGFGEPGADEVLRPGALRLRKLLVRIGSRAPAAVLEAAMLRGRTSFVNVFEPWAARVADEVEAMDEAERAPWMAMLAHLQGLSSARPSAKWGRACSALVAAVGADEVRTRVHGWIDAMRDGTDEPMEERNADLARGMAWCLVELGGDEDARALGDMALLCATKIPGIGQRSVKVANACISALGEMAGDAAMAQVTRLRAKVKYAQTQVLIDRALLTAAARRGLTPDEVEELAAPGFGMDEPGVLREELGEWTAELRVTGTTGVETSWVGPGGKRQKSAPSALAESHGEALKQLKKTAKEMQDALAAQRARLEALPMEGRTIPFAAWRERYLDHPLLAGMCRRLIWRFEDEGVARSGAWLDGALVDADDRPLDDLGDGTRVRPWHPIAAAVEEIAAWRAWLDRHGVTQPYKQAHREVYRLTDAERETRVYSNRFAAHVLRQHQLAALARGRGWSYQMQGAYDSWSAPTLRLPPVGLVAELWVNPVEGPGAESASGVWMYMTTDQVRFLDAAELAVPLETVPPLAFSEAMRDVDLFVGVASVGTDPAWEDGGPHGFGAYWTEFAFGGLSASAETRRDVLRRLLPRLRIAGVCSLDDRFLEVRGTLRTYRIHLGSGNVMMEPGSQYLCIVPDKRASAGPGWSTIPLPFEGDTLLSLILSKAFLLADDARITDRVILHQIHSSA